MKSNNTVAVIGLFVVVIILTSAFFSGCLTSDKQNNEIIPGFIVNEWGVYCQYYNSKYVSALGEPLPQEPWDPGVERKPVIYFHNDEDLSNVHVEVHFNGTALVTIPSAALFNGGLSWDVDIVNNTVIAPNGTVYPYLFYECSLSNPQGILAHILRHDNNVTFFIENIANYPISDVFFIYGCPATHSNATTKFYNRTYIYIDSLESGENTTVSVPLQDESLLNTSQLLVSLKHHGLTEQETQELLDFWTATWFTKNDYPFSNNGSFANIIYMIPEDIYDAMLPISITPQPMILNRVGLFFITGIPLQEAKQ
jgi:hypothetical protein